MVFHHPLISTTVPTLFNDTRFHPHNTMLEATSCEFHRAIVYSVTHKWNDMFGQGAEFLNPRDRERMRLPIFLQEVAAVYISSLGATGEWVCVLNMCRESSSSAPQFKTSATSSRVSKVQVFSRRTERRRRQSGRRRLPPLSPLCMTYGGAGAIMYFVIRIMAVQTCMPH
jgi:hypothetical protein